MKINFRQVQPQGAEFVFSRSAEELELSAEGCQFPEPIDVEVTVSNSGDELIVQGAVATVAELECSRCLDVFDMPIKTKLQFVIQLLEIDSPQDSNDDDFVILPRTAGEYDISDRVRDSILLELPLKPLCSDSCKGLCPMCGANLNEAGCDCTPDKHDERWDALKQLFDE